MAGTGLGWLCAPESCAGGGLVWRRQQQYPLPSHPDLALEGLTQPCLMSREDGVRRR